MTILICGDRQTGAQVRNSHTTAVGALSNILRSTLGPKGLDKMIVDELGEFLITNDGATILRRLEVQHPAAQIIVDLSESLDKEVGDGTTSVVLLASELLRKGNELVGQSIHPTSVMAGYKLALKKTMEYLEETLSLKVNRKDYERLLAVARTTLSSKCAGTDDEHFAKLCVEAIKRVEIVTDLGDLRYPVQSVAIVKAQGGSMKDSFLVDGYCFAGSRVSQGLVSEVEKPKIAFLDFAVKQHRMQLGISVEVTDPTALEEIRRREKDIIRSRILKIIESGAKVVFCSQGIDDMAARYFVEHGVLAVRRVPKKCMKQIARLTGGTVCLTMATTDGEEDFSSTYLGSCDRVRETTIGSEPYILIEGVTHQKAASVILRGANDMARDEIERSLNDALFAVSRTLQSERVCPGGGAVEVAVSVQLNSFAKTLPSSMQMAVAAFADSLLVIPRCLAVNAAMDSAEIAAKLRHKHYAAQNAKPASEEAQLRWTGLDLANKTLQNTLQNGVLEPLIAKKKMFMFATEAAIMLLRVDDVIRLDPEKSQGPDGDAE